MQADVGRTHMTEEIALTTRQQQIAVLVAEGKGYKEIGATLAISKNTVRTHVHRMARRVAHIYPDLEPMIALIVWVKQGQWERQREAGAA